jgi:hypothetical protein
MMHKRNMTLALLAAAAVTGCDRRPAPAGEDQATSSTSPVAAASGTPTEAAASAAASAAAATPEKNALTAERFGKLQAELSEGAGAFPTQGYVSNETTYLQVASELPAAVPSGGVYIGVGPEQNFSYIALTKPEQAYIVDVRRDNLLLHLLYKASFDVALSRAHFLALVTGRGGQPSTDGTSSVEDVIADVTKLPRSEETYQKAHRVIEERIGTYGVALSGEDKLALERIHRALYTSGLDITLAGGGCAGQGSDPCAMTAPSRPRFRELLAARDPADGKAKSFLASDESFRFVQTMQRENRIIPVVGDLAGEKTMHALAEHIRADGLEVHVVYVSNVEPYLRSRGVWDRWQANVAALPVHDKAVLVRTYFGQTAQSCDAAQPLMPGMRPGTTLEPISALAKRDASAG